MPGFHVEHFGCRAARADGEALSERLRAAGLAEDATGEVVVVNTCSVTAEADREARAYIRRTHRRNPAARIVVTGCYAQRAPDELAGMGGVAAVIGNSHKALAAEIALGLASGGTASWSGLVPAASLLAGTPVWVDDRFAHSFIEEAQLAPGAQTRPNLKIQEGCGNRCTFCVIPETRGASRSLPQTVVMRQVEGYVAAGGKELVLSGINLGRWGADLASEAGAPRATLAALVRRILSETRLPQLRLSSIEPMDWTDELIGLMREFGGKRLCRHAHLPLQSGSDAVLRRMHRRYRPWHYVEKVSALVRACGPELTLGADVMAGFPGETEAEFEETLELVRALPFGYLHLFPFSPRPRTRGWALHGQAPVAAAAVEERMAALRALAAEKSRAHREQFVGRAIGAVTLRTSASRAGQGRTSALAENFLPVELEGQRAANELVRVRVGGLTDEGVLRGEAMEAPVDFPGT